MKRHRKLTAETLESRFLMAGEVLVELVGDTLTFEGDGESNCLGLIGTPSHIEVIADPSSTLMFNANCDRTEPTRINGTLDRLAIDVNLVKNIVVHLNGNTPNFSRNEAIYSESLQIPGDISINTGAGADVVQFWYENTIGGDLTIDTGLGDDRLLIEFDGIGGNVDVNTGQGHDRLIWYDSAIAGNVQVESGHGSDVISLALDTGGDLFVNSGAHNDQVAISANVLGDLSVSLGQGDDTLQFFGPSTEIAGSVQLNGDQGFDRVSYLDKLLADDDLTWITGFEELLAWGS